MIKKLIIAILVALPFTAMAQKFGVVDAETIFTAMPEYKDMETQMAEKSKMYEEELGKLQSEIEKKYAEFQSISEDATTPDAIKERRIQEIQELDNKAQQFRNTAMQDLQRLQQQLTAPLQQKFQEAVQSVGQEGGFTFIFQKSMALYEGTTVEDVTAAVKAKLGIK